MEGKVSTYKVAGMKLRALRQERGWTQKEVADSLAITEGFLSFLESGTKQGSLDTYIALAELYHIALPDLFDPSKQRNLGKEQVLILSGLSPKAVRLVKETVRALRSKG
jgi:transcriptional regulator with XRE-family HTH domain